jgi:hypothetical protein
VTASNDSWRPPPEPPSFRDFVGRAKQHAAVEKELIAAVRSRGGALAREQRRVLLEEELQRRGLTRDPIWLEQKLDDLEASGPQRAGRYGQAIVGLGELASSLRRGGGEESAMPEWMRPPPDAQVDVCSPLVGAQRSSEKSAIVLDTETDEVLERAIEEAPVRSSRRAAGVLVWFDRAPTDQAPVPVYLGSHKIGAVAPDAAPTVRRSLDAAAELGERPQAHGVLARADHLQPPYLLLVTLPADVVTD